MLAQIGYNSSTMDKTPVKTKILFVITKSNFGGAQKYVFDLATSLPRDSFEVVVILGGAGLLNDKLTEKGVRTITLTSLERNINPLKDFKSFVELWRIFSTEKPDVVHLNSAKASGLGALAGRLAGVPKIIFTAHGWAFNEDRSHLSRFIIKIISWATILLSHKTIAVSGAVKDNTKNWPFTDKKVVVVKNGIKEPVFLSREMAQTELIKLTGQEVPKDAFTVGTIAELHKNKGLTYAIEAFAKLVPNNPSLYYFILGGGEEESKLKNLIDQHQLENRVFLLGFVDNAASFLPAFDMFLLPSITEGLALVLLEAGLASLPVVATGVGGIPEVIKHEKTGILVPARDPQAIVDAVQKLITSPSIRTTFGDALRERVIAELSLDRTLTETVALYTKK